MMAVAGVRLGNGDGVEDADEAGLARPGGLDNVLDDRGAFVVEDLSGSATLDHVVVVRTSDGDAVHSSGRSDRSRHGSYGGGSAVHGEGLAVRRCRVL